MLGCCCGICKGELTEAVTTGLPSVGSNATPYRHACNDSQKNPVGWAYKNVIAEIIKDKYGNTTSDAPYDSTACGSFTSAPRVLLERYNLCGTDITGGAGVSCGTGYPSVDLIQDESYTGTPTPANNYGNTFTHDGTMDFALCRKKGFKNVQSLAIWHGMYPFDVEDSDGHICDTGDFAQKKYTSISVTLETDLDLTCEHVIWTGDSTDPADQISRSKVECYGTQTWSYTQSVDATTGVMSATKDPPFTDAYNQDGYSTTDTYPDAATWSSDYSITASNWLYEPYGSIQRESIYTAYNNWAIDCAEIAMKLFYGSETDGSFKGTAGDFAAAIANYSSNGLYTDLTVDTFDLTEDKLEIYISLSGDENTILAGDSSQTDLYKGTVNNDSYFHITIQLSGENNISSVYGAAQALPTEWDLSDDAEYPWRTDNNAYIAPLVTRNEWPSPRTPRDDLAPEYWDDYPDSNSGTWTDPMDGVLDGDPIGGPLPAGYGHGGDNGGVFDYSQNVYWRRWCDSAYEFLIGRERLGEYTPSYLPQNAPKWTRGEDIGTTTPMLWPCAFAIATTKGVYIQVWREIQEIQNSFDFARPYGADRYLFDETETVYKIDDYSSPGNIMIRDCAGNPITSHTFTGVWGGQHSGINGFFTNSTTDGSGILTLGSAFSGIPTGWSYYNSDASIYFGKLRFPSAPGFGNLLECDAVYDGGTNTTTFTVASSPYILTGDVVDGLETGVGWTASITLTKVSDTSFTCSGDKSNIDKLVPHEYLCVDPATSSALSGQKYYFANNTYKGDFVWREWIVGNDDSGVISSDGGQECLTFSAKNPRILGAGTTGNYTIDYPDTLDNGTRWIAQFEQWMLDPLAQAAHTPCDDPATENDWPYFEAVLAPPDNYGSSQNETAPTPLGSSLNPTVTPPDVPAFSGEGEIKTCISNNPIFPWMLV